MRTTATLALAISISTRALPAVAQNGANAYLLSLTPIARAKMLGTVVGNGCSGNDAFYMGISASGFAKNKAFWSVRCRDGRAYVVEAHPDGTSSVLECAALTALRAGECFKRLPGAE
jgi:hypothetical protein